MAFDVPVAVKVWGDLACFTRPENKVERVSYPIMTPSAARGVLEAIFWKPEVRWQIREIHVLNPIVYTSFLRNEVSSRAVERTARTWATSGGGYFANEDRTQRNTVALRDVAYLIMADAVPKTPDAGLEAKYRDQFRRRVARGQCFAQPFLGCREFSAAFAEPDGSEVPQDLDLDLGRMLLDIAYAPNGNGKGSPHFFTATLRNGVLQIPPVGGA